MKRTIHPFIKTSKFDCKRARKRLQLNSFHTADDSIVRCINVYLNKCQENALNF